MFLRHFIADGISKSDGLSFIYGLRFFFSLVIRSYPAWEKDEEPGVLPSAMWEKSLS